MIMRLLVSPTLVVCVTFIVLLTPTQGAVRFPGQTNLAPLEDLFTTLMYYLVFTILLVFWVSNYGRKANSAVAVSFSLLFLSFWGLRSVNGEFFGTSWNYAAIVSSVIHNGVIPPRPSQYPGAPAMTSMLIITSGATIQLGFYLYSIVRIIAIALFIFLIASRFGVSPRDASLITMLSVIGSPYLVRLPDSPFSPNGYGTIMFFVSLYFLLRLVDSNERGAKTAFLVSYIANIAGYILSPFIILTILLAGSFHHRSKERPYLLVFERDGGWIELFLISCIIYLVGNVVLSGGNFLVGNWFSLFIKSTASLTSPTHTSGLLPILEEYIGSQPVFLAFVVIFWLLLIYVVGSALCIIGAFKEFGFKERAFLAVVAVAVLLFVLPGGSQEARILLFMPLFTSAALVSRCSKSRWKATALAVGLTIFILAVPTVVAYQPDAGYNTAYNSNIAAGEYLGYASCVPSLFTTVGIVTLDYTVLQNTYQPAGLSYIVNGQPQKFMLTNFQTFMGTSCHFFDISTSYFDSLGYNFGEKAQIGAESEALTLLNTTSVVYENGFNTLAF